MDHLTIGLFYDHSNTRLVHQSDPHCICGFAYANGTIYFIFFSMALTDEFVGKLGYRACLVFIDRSSIDDLYFGSFYQGYTGYFECDNNADAVANLCTF